MPDPGFHALLTCGRPKQSASSRFCSRTVHAPAKPKPLRSHSMASPVAAQVEGQAHAAERRDLPRPRQVLLLAAAPAVHEQHARDECCRADQSAGNVLVIGCNVDFFIVRRHKPPRSCIWLRGRSARLCRENTRSRAAAHPLHKSHTLTRVWYRASVRPERLPAQRSRPRSRHLYATTARRDANNPGKSSIAGFCQGSRHCPWPTGLGRV